MKIQFAYKFKDGTIGTTEAIDVYDFTKQEQGDFLRLTIMGKLDNRDITINGIKFKYNDLSSIEIVFVE